MTYTYRYPKKWPVYAKEIEQLLLEVNPKYKNQLAIKPIFVVDGFSEHPEKYPNMAPLKMTVKKKYISLFLKKQGRIPWGSGRNTKTWMLPSQEVKPWNTSECKITSC
jgi:hypothetical protein